MLAKDKAMADMYSAPKEVHGLLDYCFPFIFVVSIVIKLNLTLLLSLLFFFLFAWDAFLLYSSQILLYESWFFNFLTCVLHNLLGFGFSFLSSMGK